MTKPVTPDDIEREREQTPPPDEVIQAFNDLIRKHWNDLAGGQAIVTQDEAIEEIGRLTGKKRHVILAEGLLNIEAVYREAGWHVEYEKQLRGDEHPSRFIFRRRKMPLTPARQ